MRFLSLISMLALQLARAQDPTLDQTMKSIQDTLNQQGPMTWVQTPKKAAAEPVRVTYEMSGAIGDAGACSISVRQDTGYPNYKITMTWKVPLRDVERITVESVEGAAERFRAESKMPKWDTTTDPTVFNMQVHAVAGKKFEVHRRSVNSGEEVIEKDQQMSPAVIIFREEETAQRVSRAMLKARDMCAAGH